MATGGISGGVGNTIQIHSVGYSRNSFFVYKQVYDEKGNPVEGLYADLNKDGKITADDRYRYKSPESQVFLGFTSQLTVGDFSFGFVLRGSIGNYMYNNVNSGSTYSNITKGNKFLSNTTPNALVTNFGNSQYFSDYYIENASFMKVDNVSLGYNLKHLTNLNLRASLTLQNALVVTKYSGLDPEIAGGIDNNLYPRPRTISLGLNLGF